MSGNRREFVDTNILVYAHDVTAGPKREIAMRLVNHLWQDRQGCVSTQVLQEFYVTVTRKIRRPIPEPVAFSLVAELGAWRVHAPGIGDVLDAIVQHQHLGISYWDALILRSAAQTGCEIVWSEDLNAGQKYETITVLNPFRS